jgi:hypothetical protein
MAQILANRKAQGRVGSPSGPKLQANEFLEDLSDHFGGHPKTAGRTFTGGADFFLKEIFSRASVLNEVNFGSENYTNNIISTSLNFAF